MMTDDRCQETFTQKIVSKLYLSDSLSDVSFKFGTDSIPAHKLLLAVSCPYFYDLLVNNEENNRNGTKEVITEFELVDTPKQLFKVVLKYIYLGVIDLKSMKDDEIIRLYPLTQTLQFTELINIVGKALHEMVINVENVGKIYRVAETYNLTVLMENCMKFVDKHTTAILNKMEIFTRYPLCFLEAIVDRPSFSKKQVQLFEAIVKWKEINPDEDAASVLQRMKLDSVEPEIYAEVIRPTGFISDEQYFMAHKEKKLNSKKVLKVPKIAQKDKQERPARRTPMDKLSEIYPMKHSRSHLFTHLLRNSTQFFYNCEEYNFKDNFLNCCSLNCPKNHRS